MVTSGQGHPHPESLTLQPALTALRVTAAVSGVQGFAWAIKNKAFKVSKQCQGSGAICLTQSTSFGMALPAPSQGRVDSLTNFFNAAASDLGKASVDAEVVRLVWDRLVPGVEFQLMSSHHSFPDFIPYTVHRPLGFIRCSNVPPMHCPKATYGGHGR